MMTKILDKKTVLVADDMPHIQYIMKDILMRMGCHKVLLASDGKQAISLVESQTIPIDLIISDWKMPGVSGLDFFKWTKSYDKTKNVPFLMITSERSKKQVVDAVKSGVRHYVGKPFKPQEIMDKITQLIENQGNL
ncbi:MAG: response regulator [gamma proteobacterium symbiont of Taylorina sp.]|nr:response regulator [gamma proteobacterium symbiont of Taylorina sp.]